jgi:hypothetical protein
MLAAVLKEDKGRQASTSEQDSRKSYIFFLFA